MIFRKEGHKAFQKHGRVKKTREKLWDVGGEWIGCGGIYGLPASDAKGSIMHQSSAMLAQVLLPQKNTHDSCTYSGEILTLCSLD